MHINIVNNLKEVCLLCAVGAVAEVMAMDTATVAIAHLY